MTTEPTGLPQPFNAEFFTDPYGGYARLRDAAPVHRIALPDGSPVWLVLREVDVRAGMTDRRLTVDKAHAGTGYTGFSLPPALDANLLNMDHEDHRRLRRLVATAFTPRRVDELRESVERAAHLIADHISGSESVDLVNDFSVPLPLVVIGDLLDIPESARRPFSEWVSNMLVPQSHTQVSESVKAIHAFLVDLVSARRKSPGTDLLSGLIAARDHDDKLTEEEMVSLAFLLLMAGSENVQHLISNGVHTLLQHQDQLEAVRSDPALLAPAVEELMRWGHPNHMAIRRFPIEPVRIGGTRVPAGDTVLFCLASANRDPHRYSNPDDFNIHREDKTHLALGHGPHFCLGASLARMEVQGALHVLTARFPKLGLAAPDGELRWRASFRSRALQALPVNLGV
ncbi:cytochrome P450 [Streptomyces sp. NPDC014733]|uniref:cytochrome P450 family protein n=1 Tax=Streptomyces sp. NPDC014733 TaxID=3364885 RepID=UPI0036FCA7F9